MAFLRRSLSGRSKQPGVDLQKARTFVNRVKDAGKTPYGKRSFCMALITEARIFRQLGDASAALEAAQKAKTGGGDLTFTLIDACIGIGEAALELGNIRAAISEFEEAFERGKSSPKVAAVCHLHLCRAFLASNQVVKASEHYKLWESMAGGLQNAFLASLAASVGDALADLFQDFTILKTDVTHWPSTTYLNWVRRWLADTAVALENGDKGRAAKRLDIGVEALRLWLKMERKIV